MRYFHVYPTPDSPGQRFLSFSDAIQHARAKGLRPSCVGAVYAAPFGDGEVADRRAWENAGRVNEWLQRCEDAAVDYRSREARGL